MPLLDALPLADSSNLLAARELMAFTLGFHIVLSCIGVAFPAIILIAHFKGLRNDDADALELAKRWSKVFGVTFAVGAVTGTVLSFEFGLLWPEFMKRFGSVIGVAFAIEGIFFFIEAIFLAVYIYGWKRLRGWAHFWAGAPMFLTGIGGAFSIVTVNAWMNQPQGFTLNAAGEVIDTDPIKILFNPATGYEVPHMILAAYIVAGMLVASVYAAGMLKGRRDRRHRLGLLIPLTVALIASPIQFYFGDLAARKVADHQPAKFAGMECIYKTGRDQTEYLGGVCTGGEVKGGIGIPGLDSWLVGFSTDTKVTGLDAFPEKNRPPANTLLHLSFDFMVGVGSAFILLGIWLAFSWWRKRDFPQTVWFLRIVSVCGVAAVLTLWAGWIVTEVGRQPWIVQGHMRTADAVTPAGGIWFAFAAVLLLYTALGTTAILIIRRMARRWREGRDVDDEGAPYAPPVSSPTAEPAGAAPPGGPE